MLGDEPFDLAVEQIRVQAPDNTPRPVASETHVVRRVEHYHRCFRVLPTYPPNEVLAYRGADLRGAPIPAQEKIDSTLNRRLEAAQDGQKRFVPAQRGLLHDAGRENGDVCEEEV